MSKKSSPTIPDAPSFQNDPNVGWSQDTKKGIWNFINSGLTGVGGQISGMLGEAVNLNPDIARLATEQYVSAQEPAYRRGLQDITNTLEANNQLTGSTTGNVLQNYQNDYLAGLTSANAGMQLANIDRALNNRMQLYNIGVNEVNSVGSTGLENQQQMNSFALANYENQVAAAMLNNQGKSGNGLWGAGGALGGSVLGAALGSVVPGIGTAVGASIGAGLGGQIGSSIGGTSGSGYGSMMSSGVNMYAANKYAAGNPNIISSRNEAIYNQLAQTPSYYGQGLGSGSVWGF